jgi:hypothetical protein
MGLQVKRYISTHPTGRTKVLYGVEIHEDSITELLEWLRAHYRYFTATVTGTAVEFKATTYDGYPNSTLMGALGDIFFLSEHREVAVLSQAEITQARWLRCLGDYDQPIDFGTMLEQPNKVVQDVMERLDAVNPSETRVHPMYRVQVETYEPVSTERVEAVQIRFDCFTSKDARLVKDWLHQNRAALFVEADYLFGHGHYGRDAILMLRHPAAGYCEPQFTKVTDGDYIIRLLSEQGVTFDVLSAKQFELRYKKI